MRSRRPRVHGDEAWDLLVRWLESEILSTSCMNTGYIRAERLRVLLRMEAAIRRIRRTATKREN